MVKHVAQTLKQFVQHLPPLAAAVPPGQRLHADQGQQHKKVARGVDHKCPRNAPGHDDQASEHGAENA